MKIREMNGIMNQIAYYSEIAESSCENDEARKAIREFGNFLRANISCASMCDDEMMEIPLPLCLIMVLKCPQGRTSKTLALICIQERM